MTRRSGKPWRLFLLIAVSSGGLARPADAVTSATPQWEVDGGLGQCVLDRNIADAAPFKLSIRTLTGTDSYDLYIIGEALPEASRGTHAPLAIDFANADRHFNVDGVHITLPDGGGKALVILGNGPEFVDALAQSSSVAIKQPGGVQGSVALPSATKAVAAFRKCMADQLIAWGADPAQFQPGGKTPVALAPQASFESNEQRGRVLRKIADKLHPTDAFHAQFQLTVTTEGKVDGCKRADASVKDGVEQIACAEVINHRLYKPASDPAGKPVRGVSIFDFWVIPGPFPGPLPR